MADKESMAKSFKEKELEVFKQVTKDLQDELKREKKLREHYQWRGSKLPPFSIEHLPGERERLGGAGMTAEDRALRKQYFEDQRLAAHEPVAIPELQRRNPIRKLGSIPMQGLESVLKPFVVSCSLTTYSIHLYDCCTAVPISTLLQKKNVQNFFL